MKTFLFLTVVLTSSPLFAQLPATTPEAAGMDAGRLGVMHATIERFVHDGNAAGAITLVARDGKTVDLFATGYRDLEKKLPMQRDTICRIYSMSKIVTAVAVLALWEDGKFNLDDSVSDYLPELKDLKVMTGGTADAPQLEPAKRPITIHHLLTHTSGFGYDFDGGDATQELYRRANLWSGVELDGFIKKVATLPLHHQPGDAYTYGINFDILGALIERVSGERFDAFLQKRIFDPLSMRDTGFSVPEAKGERLAKTYKHGPDGKLVEAEPIIRVRPESGASLESGGGGLFSTADDYARFAEMLLEGGALDGRRIIGRKTVELMCANHLASLPQPLPAVMPGKGFGYGVEVTTDIGRGDVPASAGQFGWYGAATTYCQIDPHERLVAIALFQHFPFNEHHIFAKFATGYYQAVK